MITFTQLVRLCNNLKYIAGDLLPCRYFQRTTHSPLVNMITSLAPLSSCHKHDSVFLITVYVLDSLTVVSECLDKLL